MLQDPRTARLAFWAAASLLLVAGLGNIDVWAPDEPRYIQVAEEMRSLEHGAAGLVLLRLNGEVYTQKPPLYYALAALAGTAEQRVREWSARLPSALAGLGLVALTLWLGSQLFGARSGWLGAALLLTVYQFAHSARRIQLDVLLALLETLALACFWSLDRGRGPRRLLLGAGHAALGLAVLTKGPVGFLVPVLVMATYLGWERRLRELPRLLPPWALLLSLGPGLAWIAAAAALAPEGFLGDAVGTNLIGRFFAGTSHERPFYYFLRQLPVDFLPWTLLWPWVFFAARRALRSEAGSQAPEGQRAWRFLLAWLAASFLFFSLSSGKRGIYLLPAFPAVALLCARAVWDELAPRPHLPAALQRTCALLALLLLAIGVELALVGSTGGSLLLLNPWLPGLSEAVGPTLATLRQAPLAAFGAALVAVIVAASLALRSGVRRKAGALHELQVLLAAVFAIELAVFALLYPALDPVRSPRSIAQTAAGLTPPGQSIGLYRDRAMIGGLAYYGGRHVRWLSSPEEVRLFAGAGGRAIVTKAYKLHRLEAVLPLEVVARERSGSRELVVARPRRLRGDVPSVPRRGSGPTPAHGAARRRSAP